MPYIIDIILVAVVALIAFLSTRKGFILTLTDLVSGVLAFLIGKLTAPLAANFIYTNFLKEKAMEFLNRQYTDVQMSIEFAADNVLSVFGFLPQGMVSYLDNSDVINSQNIAQSIMQSVTTIEELEQKIIAPVVLVIVNMFCFAVISFIALILLRLLGKMLSKAVTAFNITERIDSILGGIFGVIKGVIYVFIIALIITVISFVNSTVAEYAADSFVCGIAAKLLSL